MKIGLCQIDGKWPNLALMKLSAWHKVQGDEVVWFSPLESSFDRVYAAKVFDFTPDNTYLPPGTIRGGTGHDLTTNLPPEVEAMCPDYTLYPRMDYALGYTTRGCIRQCPYCVVWRKEGKLKIVGDLGTFWRGQQKIALLDNNLTAAPMEHFRLIIQQIVERNLRVDFSQGLDIRLLSAEHAGLLTQVRLWKQIHFAWDRVGDEAAVRQGVKTLRDAMPLSRVMFYVLIGYDSSPEEDLYRVLELRAMGVDPFAMPYRKRDPYQRAFARWVNHKAIFKRVPWEQYRPRGGVRGRKSSGYPKLLGQDQSTSVPKQDK